MGTGRLANRVARLSGASVVRRRRAAAAAHRDARSPSAFDRWLALVQCAWYAPERIPDPELAEWATQIGAAIAVRYYEEGGAAVRAWLAGQEYAPGETFTDAQIERVIAPYYERWVKHGGQYMHPLGQWSSSAWRHLKARLTPEEREHWTARARQFREPADARLRVAARAPDQPAG